MSAAEQTRKIRVIVVHGIGNQQAGATAARWADAIVRFGRAAGYTPTVSTATFTDDPSRVTVQLTVPGDPVEVPFQPPHSVEFAIEEAHWADAFPAPTLGRVLRFLLTVAPVLAITQSITIWRARDEQDTSRTRTLRAVGRIGTTVGPLAFGILLLGVAAPVIAVLLLLLLLAASLPIPPLRKAVAATLGWLSTTIGDAFLFIADPVNRAAMQKRLAARLEEASHLPRTRTVVLAHSQGAALAYRALKEVSREARPTAFISVGSGVGRLQQVSLLQTIPWYLTPLFVAVVASAAVGIALWWDPVWTPVGLGAAAALGVTAWEVCRRWLNRAQSADLLDPIDGMSWLDIWAVFDPVPNGRTARDDDQASYQLVRVAGEQSIIRDHVGYELDWDQAMPLILERLLNPGRSERVPYRGVRPAVVDAQGRPRMRPPLAGRDWTGMVLRAVPLVAAVVALFMTDLFSLGHWLRTATPGFLDSTVDVVYAPLKTVSDFLDGTWPLAPRPQALLGALALLALGLIGAIVVRRWLTFFQRRETVAWLTGGGLRSADGGPRWGRARWQAVLLSAAALAALVPVALVLLADNAHWTREQTVQAYLTAVAEDDTEALCEITTANVTTRDVPGEGSDDEVRSIDVCGTDNQDTLRTCSDARTAIAALPEEATTFEGNAVELSWLPETAPDCDGAAPALPARVSRVDGRWQVSEVTD